MVTSLYDYLEHLFLELSWNLSILSWSITMAVHMTSWRSMRGACPLAPWWAATVGGTRPRATCRSPAASSSTSGLTTPSADLASGSDTRLVGAYIKYIVFICCALACGGEYSSPSGVIRSPYHPANYPQHRRCVYRVSAPRGQVIQIQFM